jgi:hypothetical protein
MWLAVEVMTLLVLFSPSQNLKKRLFYLFGENRSYYLLGGHLLTAILALYYVFLLTGKQKESGGMNNAFLRSCMLIAAIPIIGPFGLVIFANMTRYWPVDAIGRNEYEILDDLLLKSYTISPSFYEEPNAGLIDLIHGNLDQKGTFFLLQLVEHLPWTPHKTRILQMLLEYTRYPKIIVSAASLLAEKKNVLFNTIAELEKKKEGNTLLLACNYHEIYYLSLVDARVSKFYLDTACEYIEKALANAPEDLDIYNLAIRFFLENKDVDKAEHYLYKSKQIVMERERKKNPNKLFPQENKNDSYEIFRRNHYEFFESNIIEIVQLQSG